LKLCLCTLWGGVLTVPRVHEKGNENLKRPEFTQILFILVGIALVLAGCSASGRAGTDEATPTPLPTAAALAKPTYVVQRGEVIGTVSFTGRIAPVEQQPLFFGSEGRVGKVYVKDGETVQAGTVIADLEGAADLLRQLEISQISLQRSQLNADIAQLNFDLFVAQTPQGSSVYEKRLAIEQDKLQLAKLDVKQASLGIEELQAALSRTQLVAPMEGRIFALQVSVGSQVRAYDSIGLVVDMSQLEVSANVTDTNILDQLQVGMSAKLIPSSGLGKPGTGVVRRLSTLGGVSQPLEPDQSVRISLDLPVDASGYKLGDLLDVTVIVVNKKDVLWVPPQTIRIFSGRKFVVVQNGDLQTRVDVTLGVIGQDRVEIVTGLTEGQVVVSP
jgi:RND family efflux transporter MFP subunit